MSADGVIDGHTLHPYLLRFAPPATARAVRDGMAGEGGSRPARLGVMSGALRTRERLLLCPACARRDAAACGFGAWRRVHQLPGVLVCPEHGAPLLESSAERVHRKGRAALAVADADVVSAARRIEVPRAARAVLLRIADGSVRMLRADARLVGVAGLQPRLRALLSGYRWSRAPSLLNTSAVVDALRRNREVGHVLDAVGASLTDSQMATALNRLLYREQAAKHPLLVLLVLELVGASVADLAADGVPGEGSAEECRGASAGGGVRGPDGSPRQEAAIAPAESAVHGADRDRAPTRTAQVIRVGRAPVALRGPEWDRTLAEMLADPKLSLRAIGREFGLAPTTVMRHARRLGLWRKGWKDRPKVQCRADTFDARLLARHRASWVDFRSANPGVPAKLMPKAVFNAYRYLIREDRGWLERNHPLARPRGGTAVDWDARDREWTEKARAMLREFLRDGDGRRLSRGRIGRNLGAYSAVIKEMARLPMLAALLAEAGADAGDR